MIDGNHVEILPTFKCDERPFVIYVYQSTYERRLKLILNEQRRLTNGRLM